MERKQMEKFVIEKEWEMLQQVKGIGGRVSCQDDQETFVIMRLSQFESWPEEAVESYLQDLEEAGKNERNLVMEKYAYMMEITDPEYYASICHLLPAVSPEAKEMVGQISAQYMCWEKEIEILYPNIRKHGRVTSGLAADGSASVENYLQSELKTYSVRTLRILIDQIKREPHKNLYMISMEKLVKAYGYSSLEAAETALS